MACEIGEMYISVSEGYEEAFVNCYNNFYTDKLTVDELDSNLDIWDRFEEPFSPDLDLMCRRFAINNPDAGVYIRYSVCWDNSGEEFSEEIDYENRILTNYEEYLGDDTSEYTNAFLNILTEEIFKKIFKVNPPDDRISDYKGLIDDLYMGDLADGDVTYDRFMRCANNHKFKSEATETDFKKSIPAQLCALKLPGPHDFCQKTKTVYKLCGGEFVECGNGES